MLANEATKILHGVSAAKNAEKTAKQTFELGGVGKNLPEIKIKKIELEKGINILNLLSEHKIFSSKSEARRAIKSNALRIDNKILTDETRIVKIDDFNSDAVKISFGKKKHYFLKII